MWLLGLEIFGIPPTRAAGAFTRNANDFNAKSAIYGVPPSVIPRTTMRDDIFNPRPGRIRHGNQGATPPKTFVGETMRAAKEAGHWRRMFRRSAGTTGRSTLAGGPPWPLDRPAGASSS
jgi:hypothetical protein